MYHLQLPWDYVYLLLEVFGFLLVGSLVILGCLWITAAFLIGFARMVLAFTKVFLSPIAEEAEKNFQEKKKLHEQNASKSSGHGSSSGQGLV